MSTRLREFFIESQKKIEQEVIEMGEMVIKAIGRSVEALRNLDQEEAKRIIDDDLSINKKRWDIEERCIDLMATQQPVATELRELITILNITTELERIADHAEGIARIVIMHKEMPLVKPLIDIPRMAEKATSMLIRSIEAFKNRDANIARAICDEDDEVDALYQQVYRELLTFMMEDSTTITRATYLIWVSHNLERIADRVTNICERIFFLVTGRTGEVKVSKY